MDSAHTEPTSARESAERRNPEDSIRSDRRRVGLTTFDSTSSKTTLERFFFLAVILWCAIPLSPQSVDSDFWGHARYGWDTWHKGLAREATYTYTSIGHRWINHENLSELIIAWGAYGWGPTSLLVLKCILGCAVLLLAIAATRRGRYDVHPGTMATICVVAAINLSFYWGLRPHVFTFVLFALLIALTDWCFERWPETIGSRSGHPRPKSVVFGESRLHRLWFAPILLAIWANTHGGFLAGVAVFGLLMVGRSLEALWLQGFRAWRLVLYFALLAGIGAAATLLNPYGVHLHQWLAESLSVPRPEIQEWHPPDWFGPSSLRIWMMSGLLAAGLLATRRPRQLSQMLVLGVVAYHASRHQRHLPFVAILMLFWLPPHLQSAFERIWRRVNRAYRPSGEWLSATTLRLATLGLVLLCGLLAHRVGTRFSGVSVSNREYPVEALQFMSDQGFTGRLIVEGHWAQYVLGVMGAYAPGDPGVSVCFDGRFRTCYSQQVVDMFFDFFIGPGGPRERYRSPESPPADGRRILEYRDPQWVLINRHSDYPVGVMRGLTDQWALVYEDQLAQLWGRRSELPRFDSFDKSPLAMPLSRVEPARTYRWPAAPDGTQQQELAFTSIRQAEPQPRQAR